MVYDCDYMTKEGKKEKERRERIPAVTYMCVVISVVCFFIFSLPDFFITFFFVNWSILHGKYVEIKI